ncbi:MAG: penicillin-binding protein 2 [Proteobacteria bacterium]|nr:penicillin-binding protein 2 [Pseudomonadota bacterium]
MRLVQEYTADIEHRFKYATIAVLVLFAIVMARIFYLQVMRGSFYHFFSTDNSIKASRIPAVRGMIFDRRGQVLVDNRPMFNVIVVPQYVIDWERTRSSLSELLGLSPESLRALWEKRHAQPRYQPLYVKQDVTMDEMALIRTHKNPWPDPSDPYDLRGVEVEVSYERNYPESNIATHVLGYVREIDPGRLARYRKEHPGRYRLGDKAGVMGLEEMWDLTLRGEDGYEEIIVDAVGRQVDYEGIANELSVKPAVAGASLRLTIDRDLQEVARDMFADRKGAAVAIDPNTGAILAMYSSPSYDLNRLAGPRGAEYWDAISKSPEKFLLNRAIQGGYPPGSTYKVLNAIAALSEKVVRPDENVHCGGGLPYGGRTYRCWTSHGAISLERAISQSCDVYFYQMGLRLGVDRLAKYADIMGLGRKTGVPISGESPGLIPTSEWKQKRFGVPWQLGENLSIAVGQGYNVVVPIQNALLAAQVANGGKKLDLHLVEAAYDVDGNETYRWRPPEKLEDLPIDKEVLALVKRGMDGATKPGGTAGRLSWLYEVSMGGKTGTAQVVSTERAGSCVGERCRDHAWFIGYAPAEAPEIAASAVVEHGGFGASAAAPIVGAMLQRYHDIMHGREDAGEVKLKEGMKRAISEDKSDLERASSGDASGEGE